MTKQLFSSPRKLKPVWGKRSQRGASMIETIVVLPVLFLVGAGILHVALIAQAKSNLEYAALMAARIASSTPNFGIEAGGLGALEEEIRTRMEASDPRNGEYPGLVRVCILRPTDAAFSDFGRNDIVPGSVAIPNDNLPFLSRNLGGQSNMTIQDANLLHLRVSYLFDSNVPFLNTMQVGGGAGTVLEEHEQSRDSAMGRPNEASYGIWIQSDAVVVMQTPALLNSITESYIQGTTQFQPCPPL